jgi:hypothetical protein
MLNWRNKILEDNRRWARGMYRAKDNCLKRLVRRLCRAVTTEIEYRNGDNIKK